MYKILIIILIISFSSGFTSNLHISKNETTKNIELQVKITKNQKSKNRFLGIIKIKNKSNNSIYFNFNQNLIISKDTLTAKYNFKPISYANEAFLIAPNETKNWEVIWEYTNDLNLYNKIQIQIDTSLNVLKSSEK